ncbi:uncharacterized protein LOC109621265 [Aedes albopictus]|uniref:Uncharacterized protein n=1 Tax=Aedes albopictus TaxID=7160 RepID=A0ABM1ZHQ7_AEDAL|nr:uncharacterized protein LOC109621265 [Aedes albopictus]
MSRVILVGAFVLFLCGFLVSGAPTKKETHSDLHIEKDNHHHEFDLGHRFNVKRINGQNTPRGGWKNNPEIEIIKAILYASVSFDPIVIFTTFPQPPGAGVGAGASAGAFGGAAGPVGPPSSFGGAAGVEPPEQMIDYKVLCSLCGK